MRKKKRLRKSTKTRKAKNSFLYFGVNIYRAHVSALLSCGPCLSNSSATVPVIVIIIYNFIILIIQMRERRESRKRLEKDVLGEFAGVAISAGDCAEWVPNSERDSCLHCER